MASRFKVKSSNPEILQGQATHVDKSAAVRGSSESAAGVYTRHELSFRVGDRACAYSRKNTPISLSEGDLVTAVGLPMEEGWFKCFALRNDSTGVTYSPTIGVARALGCLWTFLGILTLPILIGVVPLFFAWISLKAAKQNSAMMELLEHTPSATAH